MDIKIRKATLKDATEIKRILIESRNEYLPYAPIIHSDEETNHWVENTLLPKSNVWLAIKNDLAIGVCSSSDRGIDTWIDQLYIKPGFLKLGAGTSLLNVAIKNSKFRHIKVVCFEQNNDAKTFYLSKGFKIKMQRDGSANEEGLPDMILQKKVS